MLCLVIASSIPFLKLVCVLFFHCAFQTYNIVSLHSWCLLYCSGKSNDVLQAFSSFLHKMVVMIPALIALGDCPISDYACSSGRPIHHGCSCSIRVTVPPYFPLQEHLYNGWKNDDTKALLLSTPPKEKGTGISTE